MGKDVDADGLFARGRGLGEGEVNHLRRRVATISDDVEARVLLAGFEGPPRCYEHIVWLIRHHPNLRWRGWQVLFFDDAGLRQGTVEWLSAVEAHRADIDVLSNAVSFLLGSEPNAVEGVIQRAVEDHRESYAWMVGVAGMYRDLAGVAQTSGDAAAAARAGVGAYFAAMRLAATPEDRFPLLWEIRQCARPAGLDASTLRLVQLADSSATLWRKAGERHRAQFRENTDGLIALVSDDLDTAETHLAQLGSYLSGSSPPMDLAVELAARGRRGAVVTYLTQCRAMLTSDAAMLTRAIEAVADEDRPDLAFLRDAGGAKGA